MTSPFILWFGIITLAWLVLRLKMPHYERLQAVGLFALVWLGLFFGLLAIPQIPSPLNLYLAAMATVVVLLLAVVYFGYFERAKYPLKEVRLSPNIDLSRGIVVYNLTVVSGENAIRRFEAQVSYGYGVPTKWANLDLREYSLEELLDGKEGKPKKGIPLLRNDQRTFTLVGLWSREDRGTFKTVGTSDGFFFKNIYWLDPFPEIYVKFVGVTEPKGKDYVVSFAKDTQDPSVDLFSKETKLAKHCIAKREQIVGRKLADDKITVWNRNKELGSMYAFIGDWKLLDKAKKGQMTVSDFPERIRRRFRP